MYEGLDMTIKDLIVVLKTLAEDMQEDDKLLARLLTYTAERLEAHIS